MKPIDQNLTSRQPVWEALQMFFMDSSPASELPRIARTCADSTYSVEELRSILFSEVFPACRSNMNPLLHWPGGEWAGYDRETLTTLVLSRHRHGKRPLVVGWLQAAYWWARLRPRISSLRAAPHLPTPLQGGQRPL